MYVSRSPYYFIYYYVVYKFGKIESVNVRSKGKDTFAFISFNHESDAYEAMKRRDGYQFDKHHRMRVEVSKGSRQGDRDRGDRGDRGDRDRDRDYDRGNRRDGYDRRDRRDYGDKYDSRGSNNRRERPTPKINENYFKVVVENLPEGCSWQDLKDFIKKEHPTVKFTEVKDGKGIAGFEVKEDAEKVIEDLNNSTLRSRDGVEATVTMSLTLPEVVEETHETTDARENDREEKDVRDDRRSRSRSHSRD